MLYLNLFHLVFHYFTPQTCVLYMYVTQVSVGAMQFCDAVAQVCVGAE